jgi:dipeptidyl aminopeptidase/acylaminoacyl peptidase
MRRALTIAAVPLAVLIVLAGFAWRETRDAPLPPGLRGTLVYVSDRLGSDALFLRRLPDGAETRLTYFTEPIREPALSPDGRRVAFTMGGRVGVVDLKTGDVRILTLGIDWRDASPAWRPDGEALVVSARRPAETAADLMLLFPLDLAGQNTGRLPLVTTRGLDETAPVFTADARAVVFVREDNLFRVDLEGGRTRRLTGGFRKWQKPVLRPDGRIVGLWQEGKVYGADTLDADGKRREPLFEGTTSYASLAPSPDGAFYAATFRFDLRFHPMDALRPRHVEDVRLLDAQGRELAPLLRSWRVAYRSAQWAADAADAPRP